MAKLIKGYYKDGVWHKYGDKLYTTTGQHTDGSMTQKATTDTINQYTQGIVGENYTVSETIDLSTVQSHAGYINNDNKWTSMNAQASVLLAVTAHRGERIRIIPTTNLSAFPNGENIAFLTADGTTSGDTAAYCTGTSMVKGYTTPFYLEIPLDAVYLYARRTVNNVLVPPTIQFYDTILSPLISIEDDSNHDLAICDANGNVILSVDGGVFNAGSFCSLDVSKSAGNLRGKVMSILGDSISTFQGWIPSGYATYYPHSPLTSVESMWWYKVASELGLSIGSNCSWSGSVICGSSASTSSAEIGSSTKRISDLALNGTPDIIVIYIGINDFQTAKHTPVGIYTSRDLWLDDGTYNTFSEAYGIMLSKVLKAYPMAKVFCCTLFPSASTNPERDPDGKYPTKNGDGVYLAEFNDVIKDLCIGYGAHLIDLSTCGITWANIASVTVDSVTHPNAIGQSLMADMIKNEILKYY